MLIIKIILVMLIGIFVIPLGMMLSETFMEKMKNKFLSTETNYIKDGFFGMRKEVVRSDGQVIEREFLKEEQYNIAIRGKKFKRLLKEIQK
jgi:hypothetical protein